MSIFEKNAIFDSVVKINWKLIKRIIFEHVMEFMLLNVFLYKTIVQRPIALFRKCLSDALKKAYIFLNEILINESNEMLIN